jgi:hypothetical protein
MHVFLVMIIILNLHSGTKLSDWLRHMHWRLVEHYSTPISRKQEWGLNVHSNS